MQEPKLSQYQTKDEEKEKSIYDVPMDLPGEKKPRLKLNLNKKKLVIICAIIRAVVIIGLLLVLKKDKQPGASGSNTAGVNQDSATRKQDVPEASNSKVYEDDTVGFKVSYPDTWTLTKTADSGVRIVSQDFNYQMADSTEASGYFRIYIRTGARSVDGKYIGRGLTIKPSESLAYDEPLPDQRKTTFLSSFGLDNTNNFGFFMIAGNFELNKGDSLGPNYGKEPETFIVAGGYSDSSLEDDLATNSVPVVTYDQSNAYTQAIDIIKSLQLR